MTPEEALKKAKEILDKSDDPAATHSDLDDLFCEILQSLGYRELVEVYKDSIRWYE